MIPEIVFDKNEDVVPDNAIYSTKPCPDCRGTGKVPESGLKNPANKNKVKPYQKDCPTCGGTKRVKK